MIVDWNAVFLPIAGVVGYALKALIDAIRVRYETARKLKREQESIEDELRRRVYEWREHAYAVRAIAINAGILPSDLPDKPDEDDV